MSSNSGKSLTDTWKQILQTSESNTGLTASWTAVLDGVGTSSGLALSTDTTCIKVGGYKITPTADATIEGSLSGTSSGTNTGDQLIFKTISVSGQSDVVADTTADTLTLVAGTNTTITTNASTDTITINNTSSSKVVQYVYSLYNSVATGTTLTPFDNTIPQNTEGDQYMTKSITPTNASNILKIEVQVTSTSSNASNTKACVSLFQDSNAGATAAWIVAEGASQNSCSTATMIHYMVAGTTSSTTFNVRVGLQSSGTLTFNGSGGTQLFGGVCTSSIAITELAV